MSGEVRRLVAFSALAAFASHHWFLLVDNSEAWRWIVCVGSGAAGALILLALRTQRRGVAIAGGALVFGAMLAAGLLAAGIPAEYLKPGAWPELADQLSQGLRGVSNIDTPYAGSDPWLRRGLLAAVPAAIAAAILASFWPSRPGRAGHAIGLGLLLALYGFSVTWEAPSAELARGALLFVFVAAVLWLPAIRLGRLSAGAAAVALALAVALPLASRVDASDPVVSYTTWSIFGDEERIGFNWNHTYGPLDWPQDGTPVFEAKTGVPTYWKAFVLDEFDGASWVRADDAFGESGPGYDLAGASQELVESHPEWVRRFDIELSALRSRLAVTSGTRVDVEGLELGDVSGDGTAAASQFEIPPESEYTLTSYVPNPTPRQLRRARGVHPAGAERYTALQISMDLSRAEKQIGRPAPIGYAAVPPHGVDVSAAERGLTTGEDPISRVVEGTQYERVLRLSRRLTAGARTDYAAVSRIQRFLTANYTYDQDVAPRRDPLPAFLLRDRRGYCQQFSGAMALMLRMVGIPSRVVSGFAPGVIKEGGLYSVSDTDAHAWVEVLYPGIGWVTVDPTPSQTPAHTNVDLPGAGRNAGISERGLGRAFTEREGERDRRSEVKEGGGAQPEGGGSPLPLMALAALGAGGAGVIVRRRRRMRTPEGAELQLSELRDAMALTGRPALAGTTLGVIQERLSHVAGPEGSRYAGALIESRYGRRPRRRPGPAERRSFRWALARSAGPLGWWKALRAIPPGGPRA